MQVNVKKVRESASLPVYGTEYSAGADLRAVLDQPVKIGPGKTAFLPTGLAFAIPEGYVGLVFARSGLACKQGLAPANKVGVIDSDYRGEVVVALYNQSEEEKIISDGDRIAQIVITPYIKAAFFDCGELEQTKRGAGGFGSTGKN